MIDKYESVFDAITDSPEEALNMKLRAKLIREIRGKLTDAGWAQITIVQKLGVTQPRVSDLLTGKLSKFSLDSLVNMLARLGSNVELRVA
jgi:predicted XRE-type DNA-binding protein